MQSRPNFESGPSFGDVVLEKQLDFEEGPQTYTLTITAKNKDALNNVNTLVVINDILFEITVLKVKITRNYSTVMNVTTILHYQISNGIIGVLLKQNQSIFM